MRQFFKFMFASMLGTLMVGVVLIFIFIGIVAAMAAGLTSTGKDVTIKEGSVLQLTLDKQIKDRGSKDQFDLDLGPFSAQTHIGLNQILASLEHAKTDDNIKGLYLDLITVNAGFATLQEIRKKIIEFKEESGKPVIAHSEFYSQAAYYLATAADEIYLQPKGDVDYRGLRTEMMFFKGMFDKLDVDIQLVRGSNNKFKAFGESFTEEKMSNENREQVRAILKDLWAEHLNAVSTGRDIPIERLNLIADSMLVRSDISAMDQNFITGAKYLDEVHDIMRERMELEADEKIEFAELKKYSRSFTPAEKKGKAGTNSSKLAVIYAEGSISSGKNSDDNIGSTSLGETLRKAREDDDVKAVVFRVNSPGGSALASEVIWREVKMIADIKPIVVSMGDVAASGGYYISAPATKIFAEATTITGSIGVFGMIPNMGGFFKNKLGITFDGEKTHRYADMLTVSRPLDDSELRIIQAYVDDIYETFKDRVAEGRNMTPEAVDAIGQGRVWTGIEAKRLGLVDELGGLEMAIAEAARLAELDDDHRLIEMPEQKEFFEKIMEDLGTNVKTWAAIQLLGDQDIQMIDQFKKASAVKEEWGIQARMPFDVNVE